MRTPGDDMDLALGFLFTEGIVATKEQIERTMLSKDGITVFLNPSIPIDLSKTERHSYTSSSCGVCGKSSLASLRTSTTLAQKKSDFKIGKDFIKTFPNLVKEQQRNFQSTGGLHAAALFDLNGNLMALREDVGRHNALDKLIGTYFSSGNLPLNEHLLFLSGRASFELVQKAAMAGIPLVMAVGAPSSLAIETAVEFGITLVGFLNDERYNIYHGADRMSIY